MAQLAILGGEPVRTKPFPQWPVFGEEEKSALLNTLENDEWGIDSKAVRDFEERFAAYCGARHAVACTNGTDALYIALQALGVGPGDEVIIPPYTFIATGIAVLMVNAVPVFADIDPGTYNLDPGAVERAVTGRSKAVIPVHIAGNPADMDGIMDVAEKHNLLVLEDTAQAHAAEWRGKKVGTIGHIGTFSFQSSKNLSAGEGGAMVTNDGRLGARLRTFTNCGRVEGGAWYDHHELAGNHRLGAFQAALLLAGLDRLDEQTRRREENAEYLRTLLGGIGGVGFQKRLDGATRHAYHLGVIQYQPDAFGGLPKARFIEALEKEGIPCASGYLPLYQYRVFRDFPEKIPAYKQLYEGRVRFGEGICPECERISDEEAVWTFQEMYLGTKSDMEDIAAAVRKIKENADQLA